MGSVAEGVGRSRPPDVRGHWVDRLSPHLVGLALMGLAVAAYWFVGSPRFYNHFVWQAMAFLHGQVAIDWPVEGAYGSGYGNGWMQDVYPLLDAAGQQTGRALLPFPPLPALVLLPFVAIWGFATDIRAVSVLLGAVNVGLCWWAMRRLPVPPRIALAATVLFGFGTAAWYAAQLGTTWFFAHVVAVTFVLLAVGVALGADRRAADPAGPPPAPGTVLRETRTALLRPLQVIDGRQFVAGLLFGLACTARLPIVFGAPFLVLVGGGDSWLRRAVSAGLGAVIPIGALLLFNLATTGSLIHPGYDYQYLLEANGYPSLHYNPAWSVEDVRYVPQNLAIMLARLPVLFPEHIPNAVVTGAALCVDPGAVRGLFDPSCPVALPDDVGMSILLTTPAYLLVIPAVLRARSRLAIGAIVALGAIAFFDLMHFSQGWVQFGYRFSNDFVVFALVLVALAMAQRGRVGWLGAGLIGLSIAVNLWGVIWGNILGW
jgi:hypothetical protein